MSIQFLLGEELAGYFAFDRHAKSCAFGFNAYELIFWNFCLIVVQIHHILN